jgi:Bacterial alpha-L-rhamnosidase 6 hairpin glycosidase domain/Bacterial alpha-L-rhamnosidase C-terminal domain
MLAPGPLTRDAEGLPCAIDLPVVLLDGVARDRCPYVGDQAVSGMTLLISTPSAAPVLRNMILWYAHGQHPNGAIPSSPERGGAVVLVDYNAYWVEDVYDYVLYTGDLELAKQVWPELTRLMDDWYPSQIGASGLLVNSPANADYANIPRKGSTVAYYNAGYVRALGFASQLAGWLGESGRASAWKARIGPVAAAFGPAFWDSEAGAFRDATAGPTVHPEDGNAFAILAGLATLDQARSALAYLEAHDWQPYGAAIADNDVWGGFPWGTDADMRVYPFISYYELLARYQSGLDDSALALIRREWGYMLANGPQTTMWETIGPYGSPPVNGKPSYDHGWSSGAAPALTSYALGVMPASPGFGSYAAEPHPGDLRWARGTVPTPHGPIAFRWADVRGAITATVVSPVPGEITLPADGAATLDGKSIPGQWGVTSVQVSSGTHTLVVKTS